MCTAATFKQKNFYFGRTLDNEFSYGEQITITPRNYKFNFKCGKVESQHYAIIGMAYVTKNYPLYFDGMNEKGVCMAGLNFVGNAYYKSIEYGKTNVAQYEFLPFILSQCESVEHAIKLIENINITDTPFSRELPVAQLHWIIADKNDCITVEAVKDGVKIYKNKVGVLTNNPPFLEQISNLNDYMHLSAKPPKNSFNKDLELKLYSKGMGAIGLPGDLSSKSRFVRTAFVKCNSIAGDNEESCVGQFFHILGAVEQQRGCNETAENEYEITVYTSCCNAQKGIYYYTTYTNRQITAVDMNCEDLDGQKLICYTLISKEQIRLQNYNCKNFL